MSKSEETERNMDLSVANSGLSVANGGLSLDDVPQLNLTESEAEAARRQIAELEAQVESLTQQITVLQKSIVDWHSAMYSAISLILKPYKNNLTIEREHLLNLMPRRIDCLVIKINGEIPIDMDVFRLFRKHNVVEFKSFHDNLDERVLWQTISYAASYRALEPNVKTEELTITIFQSTFPRKLMSELESLGWKVEQPYHNIYYLSGMIGIPVQIVITKDLGEEYNALQILTGHAREEDVRKFTEYRSTLTDPVDKMFADAVLWACSEANLELFRKMKEEERMYGALREIMKEELLREREEGRKEEQKESMRKQLEMQNNFVVRMINAERPGNEISLFTDLGRQDIDKIARKMNRTVYWNEGRA